jgi:Zn-finger nucleic acid-binding protein/ribosomal protein L40E
VRLVACPSCKAHLDVTGVEAAAVTCPCGATVETVAQEGRAGTVRRCGGCGASLDAEATVCSYCQSPIVREPQRLTLVCPECLARNPETGKYCTGCGTEFLPQPPLASQAPKPCPACEQPLVAERVREVWISACSACDGLWVPVASFDGLVKRVDATRRDSMEGLGKATVPRPVSIQGPVVYRRCPECHQRMVRKNFGRRSGVIVDWCGPHGTWFDADELERVAAFVAAGGLEPTHAEEEPPRSDQVRIVVDQPEWRDTSPWAVLLESIFNSRR